MQYRHATLEDLPAIQDLSYALFKDPTSSSDKYSDDTWAHDERGRAFFEQALKDGSLFIAQDEDKIVAYLAGGIAEFADWRPIKRAELMSFYVLPDYRSRGVGKHLAEMFIEWAKGQDVVTVMVSAYADNARAIDFYRSIGFKDESLELEIDLK